MELGEQDWRQWVAGLASGDARTLEDFWVRYGPRLQGLAAEYMTTRLYRREGPEDVVQSVCRTFFRRVQIGQFELADSGRLWGLLCVITIAKVRQKARYHRRQKRDLNREHRIDGAADESWSPGPALTSPQPTPAEAAEFADQLGQLLDGMDEEERRVVELKLEQCTNQETADKLGCSERTVRRILKRVQARLKRLLEETTLE
jgi:RNA polymerase sigma-70 factor (ECF subfamily)